LELIASFFAAGRPAPQGSKSYLGKGRFTEQSPHLKSWRHDVRHAASEHVGEALFGGPILVQYTFVFHRPKNHYRSSKPDRGLKDNAPAWVDKAPDLDKLERSTNDALTGVVWVDDSQVVATLSQKRYGDRQGAFIRLFSLPNKAGDILYINAIASF